MKQLLIAACLIMFISAGSKETASKNQDIKETITVPADKLDHSIGKLDSSLNILMKKI